MAVFQQFGAKAHAFVKRPPKYDKKYTLLEGSVRSGKTFAIDAKLIAHLCIYNVRGKRVICGATKQSVYKNILLDVFAVVGKKNYAYNRANGELWLFGVQWFVIGAKDEASYKQILGMTIGIAICDEFVEFPQSFTKQLFLRMSPDGARMYASTNPGTPQHYLFTDFINGEGFAPDLEVIHFTLEDNPNISMSAKKQIIASQKGVYFQRYILGRWVIAEGAVYKDTWDEKWLYDDSSRPVGLYGAGGYAAHVIGVDYGTHNPCTFLEYFDDGSVVWLDREYYWDSVKEMRQKTDGEYANDLDEFIKGSRVLGRCTPRIVVDPSATSFKLELVKRGFIVVDGEHEVLDGIHRVSEVEATGHRRVHKDCKNWRREHGLYSWDTDKALKSGDEAPLKVNDHTQDADRYAIMDLFPDWRILIPLAA